MKTCSIDGCQKQSDTKGWCGMHHMRWKRHGDPHWKVDTATINRAEAIAICQSAILEPGTAHIPLTKGFVAVVDRADYPWLSQYNWFAQMTGKKGKVYAACHIAASDGKTELVLMHRLIVGAAPDEYVDHRDRETLSNRRSNLRRCTQAQNCVNNAGHTRRNKTSRYKGVSWQTPINRWAVSFRGKYIGVFKDEAQAARAYDAAAHRAEPQFAYLNFPSEVRP